MDNSIPAQPVTLLNAGKDAAHEFYSEAETVLKTFMSGTEAKLPTLTAQALTFAEDSVTKNADPSIKTFLGIVFGYVNSPLDAELAKLDAVATAHIDSFRALAAGKLAHMDPEAAT